MYAARGIAVSLTVFFLTYSGLSLAVFGGWELLRRRRKDSPTTWSAGALFAVRIVPLLASLALTFAFTVPSFLLLEPRSANEEVGVAPLILGFCCLILIALGIFRAARAQAEASRVLAGWLRGARSLPVAATVPVFQTKESAPLLSVAGVCKAKVLVSDSALRVLDERELRTALRHELAHVRGRDNLKKLILRFSPFPGMGKLDRAWSEAAEIAADDAAVNSAGDALDLASALIKLSRLAPLHSPAPLTSGLLESSAANVKTRVERLFAWEEIHRCDTRKRQWWWYSIPLALALCMSAVVSYGAVLMQLHEVTEWLVR